MSDKMPVGGGHSNCLRNACVLFSFFQMEPNPTMEIVQSIH